MNVEPTASYVPYKYSIIFVDTVILQLEDVNRILFN
jgi:hypothetical protein